MHFHTSMTLVPIYNLDQQINVPLFYGFLSFFYVVSNYNSHQI